MSDLTRITAAGKHLLTLINDVLDFSKVEAGKTELVREDVRHLADPGGRRGAVSLLAQKNGNQLVMECAPGLSAVEVDAVKLRQSLSIC